eukprot:symbB.v1.2.014178.t1/scaffold1030.1/size143088/2
MDSARPRPVVAVMPDDVEFDEEVQAALACGFPVCRFHLDATSARIVQWLGTDVDVAGALGIFRGYMLSRQRRKFLHESLEALGVNLLVTPSQYENAHFFPATYATLASLSPRACWQPVESSTTSPEIFQTTLREVESWGCRYVLLKDYVKSAKAHGTRFMQVPVDDELPDTACDFVHARGARFNEGVVFKEYVELARYPGRGDYTTNEWRLWFIQQELVEISPNSFQVEDEVEPVPVDVLQQVTSMAQSIDNPYITIDVAETVSGTWMILEAGDAGVSGLAPNQEPEQHWAYLRKYFHN